MKFIFKLWKDSVASKIIATGIIGSLLLLGRYVPIFQDLIKYRIEVWVSILLILLTFFSSKFYFKKEYNKKTALKKEEQLVKSHEKYVKENNDVIWKTFYGLNESDLSLLKEIFNSPKSDPDNKRCRMISKFDLNKYQSPIEKTNIPTGNRSYRPCIMMDYIGDKIHLTLEEYFHDLLENFSVSGEKKKL